MIIRRFPDSTRGIAIILFLTIIVLGITTLLVTQVSTNRQNTSRSELNANVLDDAAQALMGYALLQPVAGGLPCPDTNGDGFSNPQGSGCVDLLGLLPVRELGLDNLTDASGAALWYAVPGELLANSPTVKNSSSTSSLTLDGMAVVAIIIAPGNAINGQNRNPLTVTDFLEGLNADADHTDFESIVSATQNDQILAIRGSTFWGLIEDRVNAAAESLVNQYRSNCGVFPWAADFGGSADSVITLQAGSLPLGTALPFDWGGVCGLNNAPAVNTWLAGHWQDQLFYRMCTLVEGTCLTVLNHPGSPSSAVIAAAGVPLPAQTRPSANIDDYFELENSDADDSEFLHLPHFDHDGNFNDTVTTLP